MPVSSPTVLNRSQQRKLAHDQRRGVDTSDPDYFPEYSPDPVIVRPETAMRMLDCGPTRLYQILDKLDSFTDGRRRYITTESIHRYIAKKLAEDDKSPAGSTVKAVKASVHARKAARERQATQ
jgi:hypothetical protein